ncbi:MAG: hypothetical protein HQL69_24290 [Magnetococcales bacterium]|nr:hypothetical protein [Magnetococcales bacterium]
MRENVGVDFLNGELALLISRGVQMSRHEKVPAFNKGFAYLIPLIFTALVVNDTPTLTAAALGLAIGSIFGYSYYRLVERKNKNSEEKKD